MDKGGKFLKKLRCCVDRCYMQPDNLLLSMELIMLTSHRIKLLKLRLRTLALNNSDQWLALETSALEALGPND